jgi:hypothetical protein
MIVLAVVVHAVAAVLSVVSVAMRVATYHANPAALFRLRLSNRSV